MGAASPFERGDVMDHLFCQITGRLGARQTGEAVRDTRVLFVNRLTRGAGAKMSVNGLLQRGLALAAKLIPQCIDVTTTHERELLLG